MNITIKFMKEKLIEDNRPYLAKLNNVSYIWNTDVNYLIKGEPSIIKEIYEK